MLVIDLIFQNWWSLVGQDFFFLVFISVIIVAFLMPFLENWLR